MNPKYKPMIDAMVEDAYEFFNQNPSPTETRDWLRTEATKLVEAVEGDAEARGRNAAVDELQEGTWADETGMWHFSNEHLAAARQSESGHYKEGV